MVRIKNIVLAFDHGQEELDNEILGRLQVPKPDLIRYTIVRKSLDARKKNQIKVVYTVDAEMADESRWLALCAGDPDIDTAPSTTYIPPKKASKPKLPPVIVGSGPCGLFASLILAEAGFCPIVIERGKNVSQRIKDVNNFWHNGILDPESNVCFGEGGAGTFSDGKLTTQIKDKSNRIRKILREFVEHGAKDEILFQAKPHIGTDHLITIVKNLRKKIISLGGQIRFENKLTGIEAKSGRVLAAIVNDKDVIETNDLVLAIGHSARETYKLLHQIDIPMIAKPFSMGVRIEHPQEMINISQFGDCHSHPLLGPADYKLVCHSPDKRSVYTFCMCPGGKVIASSSEERGVATNGMSMHARHFENANSALLVNVETSDFENSYPLSGIDFQRKWEEKAFTLGGENYFAPAQMVGDFLVQKTSEQYGRVKPSYQPDVTMCDLRDCLPGFVADTLRYAIGKLNNTLKGFAMPEAVMTAIETRSSSPVKIIRTDTLESPALAGLYPAGEGAGHAGGIVSSAVDGIRVAEAIIG